MTGQELRIMQMDVLINAQRARIELSAYAKKQIAGVIPREELESIGDSYSCLNKIIKELSNELKL